MSQINPSKAIVPILKLDADGSIQALVGTGFFVGARPAVVTAKHVFQDNPLNGDEQYAMAYLQPDGSVGIATVNDYLPSDNFDIVVFAAGTVPGAVSLKLLDGEVPTNQDVLAYEFSSSSIERLNDGRKLVAFRPLTHKGNVMRHYVSEFPEKVPTPSFDTSFPALQGASGAPVLRADDYAVVGMLVANRERHLMPAQVVKVELGKNKYEEVKYFLPTGKGLEAQVLIQFLNSINANPEIAR